MAEIRRPIEQTKGLALLPSLEDAVATRLGDEAVSETPDVKQSLYALLDNLCSRDPSGQHYISAQYL
jgi:hypothetical protein